MFNRYSIGRRQVIFCLALTPLVLLIWDSFSGQLGANPVETLSQRTGIWALRFLFLTLAFTPARMLFNSPAIMSYRRMIGLFTFFYSSLHVFIYLLLEQGFTFRYIIEDITVSFPIDLGWLTYLLLIPLFITSTQKMMRRLGKNWKKLHNSIHFTAWIAILHFLFSEKADLRDPLIYAGILLSLMLLKTWLKQKQKQKQRPHKTSTKVSIVPHHD